MAWQDQGITTESNSENSSFFSKTFNLFITFELTLVIFLISISKYLIKFLIAIKFYESYKYLPFLYIGVAYAAFAAYVGVGYQRNKATKAIFKTTVVGGVINVTTSLLLLKYIGLYAPALGTLLSFSAIYAIRKRQTNSFFPINVNTPKLIILTLVSLFYYVQFFIDNIFFNLSLIGIAVFLFVFLNRSLFLDIFSLINKKRRTA
jgi:O-antigen/teichoic acid export membrane protein